MLTYLPRALPCLFLLLMNCHHPEQPQVRDCDCDSKTYRSISNIQAAYGGHNMFMIRNRPDSTAFVAVVNLCEPLQEELPVDIHQFLYRLSGELVEQCPLAGTSGPVVQVFNLRKAVIDK